MRILVTNDDGIHAPGLSTLEEIARELSDDWGGSLTSWNEEGRRGRRLSLRLGLRTWRERLVLICCSSF